jgi:Fic family protein
LLPEDLLWVEVPEKKERVHVVPGELRKSDVVIGTHVAVSAGAVPRFLARFAEVYEALNKTDSILAAATAHHRLLWIHPFLDGNGRVARLMSHAMLLESLETGAGWSVARGLARNVEGYKRHLIACDQPRRNDLDGRGQLSEEALAGFAEFFLGICIDQVDFMEGLVQPERLRTRIRLWAEEEIRLGNLPPKSENILEAVLYRGGVGARGLREHCEYRGSSGKADCFRAARSRCTGFGEPARSVAARISSSTGFSLDAGLVPRKRDIA